MQFYGFKHRYGADIVDDDGITPVGKLVIFTSRAKRDAWVDDGPVDLTVSGVRTALSARIAFRFQTKCANVVREG